MHTGTFNGGKGLYRAGKLALQSALIVDLFGKLADAHFLIFK